VRSLKPRRIALPAFALAAAIGLGGCSSSLSASDIAQQAKTQFNQKLAAQGKSQRVASVSCPRDLPNRVGASEVCSGIGNPGHVDLHIMATITSISGSTAHLNFSISVGSGTPGGTSTT
jgi:hypothetical protein